MEEDKRTSGPKQEPTTDTLHPSEDQLRLLFENVQEYAIFSVTLENIVDSWNAGAERLLGYTAQEIVGQPGAIIFTDEDRRRGEPEKEFHQALTNGRAEDERWHVRKDGSRFYSSGILMAIRDAAGNLRGCVKVLRDWTAQQRTEAALHANEEHLRLVIESIQDYAILTLNSVGQVTSWNTGGEHLFGYSDEEIIGQSIHRFYTPEDLANGKPEHELQLARVEGRSEDESWRVRKDGSRFWCNEIIRPLHAADGTKQRFVKVCRDLTERRQAEEALQRAHEFLEARVRERTAELAAMNAALQAEMARRNQADHARSALLRALVTAQEDERRRIARELHDQLGQNITALGLALAALQDHLPAGTPQRHILIRAQQLVARLDKDVDRLVLELRPSNMDDVGLLATIQQHVEEWSAHHLIATEFESIGWRQERLPAELETVVYRVIQEALTNVLKHARAQHVSIILEQRHNTIQLIIEDDGQGFDLDAVQRGPEGYRHLGLVGMQERVALVGGRFTIETAPGHGTTLFIHIPFSSGTPEETGNGEGQHA